MTLLNVSEGKNLAQQGEITQAIALFQQIQRVTSNEIDAPTWNGLCWDGSLWNQAAQVMFACENAVKLAPDDGVIRDSRGLARALTGDFDGAIEDFEFYVNQGAGRDIAQREAWLKELKAGRNPITPEVLAQLRGE